MKKMYITIENFTNDKLCSILPCDTNIQLLSWLDITGNMNPILVGNILHSIILYIDLDFEDKSAEEILRLLIDSMKEEGLAVAGGIHFCNEQNENIYPSCCCGLEQWKYIVEKLKLGESPWMGHDPFVNCKTKDHEYLITTESEYNRHNTKIINLYYQKEDFLNQLNELDKDFEEFVDGPLMEYIGSVCPQMQHEFVKAFKEYFNQIRM